MAQNLGDVFGPHIDFARTAIIDERRLGKPWSISYRELDDMINGCARGLVRAGLKRGDRIAIMSANRAEHIAAFIAILRAGMVGVPVNYKVGAETVAYVYEDSDIRFTFSDDARLPSVPAGRPIVRLDDGGPKGWAAFLDKGPFQVADMDFEEEAAVLYTSGSTGRPKGVPLLHKGQLWIRGVRFAPAGGPPETTVVAAPFFHMNGLGSTFAMICNGGTAVIQPEFRPTEYVRAIREYRATILTTVTTMMAMVLRDRDQLVPKPIDHVKVVRVGSAPVTPSLVAGIKEVFPKAWVGNAYGVTEAGQIIFGPHPKGLPMPEMAVGYPLPGAECRLTDAQGSDTDEGVLWIRSPAVMKGYLNLPEKTNEVLTKDGWYFTKDIFRRNADGFYFFVGRVDDMFVCGGENVYPSEVEGMLEKHPAVAQAAVVAVPDEIKGAKPVAFVVPKAGHTVTEDELKTFALNNGPAYQHPRMIVFRDSMPWAGTNKIDRKTLSAEAHQIWREHAPDD
jgi:acyl-CoA synthetase (AMP-forming)/AMP-acid ligase II